MMLSKSAQLRGALPIAIALLFAACGSPEEQKQRHFAQGDAYAAEKRDDFAVIEYANAVRIDPKFGEARLKLAETYERMNNFQAAFPEYIRAADALPNNRDVQIKATELLLLGRRFEDAKARATTLLIKNPKDVDALLLRANAMASLKEPEAAIAEIQEVLKLQPDESRAYLSLADISRQSGDVKEAETAFRQAIQLAPSSVAAHIAFANFLWSVGRQGEAEQEIKQGLSIEPRHLLANRMLAALYSATNRMNEAEQPLKIVAETSKTADARFDLAQYYVSAGRDSEAIKALTALAADQATFVRAEAMLASIDYGRGRTKEAHARIDKLLTRAPNDAPALVLKAQWLTNEQKLDEALKLAKAAISADPQSALAHYTLGAAHSRRGEVTDAMNAYTEVLRLNPRFVAAQIELSRLNRVRGDSAAAVRHAEEAAETAPGNADAHVALVRGLLTRGDLDRAGVEIAGLLRGWPDSAAVHALNGTLSALRSNQASARASYAKALSLSPENVEAIGGLIALDLQNKQFDAAVNRIDAALAKQPNSVQLLTVASRVYDRAGQQDRAEQALRRAVAADPRFLTGYGMLAERYVRQGRLDDARTEFETIVKRDPRAVGARTMVGMILEAQGKRAEARKWYEATVADLPSAAVAANNLAFMYAEEGTNLDMAVQLASSAKKALPESPQVSDTLGWAYYKKNLPALAVGPLEESAKALPDNADVLYHLGMTYAKLNEKAKAREALERALKINPKFAGAANARQTLASLTS